MGPIQLPWWLRNYRSSWKLGQSCIFRYQECSFPKQKKKNASPLCKTKPIEGTKVHSWISVTWDELLWQQDKWFVTFYKSEKHINPELLVSKTLPMLKLAISFVSLICSRLKSCCWPISQICFANDWLNSQLIPNMIDSFNFEPSFCPQ